MTSNHLTTRTPIETPYPAPLSLEAMRDDLATTLGMSSESISDDADLISLGLDSIRAMRLVGHWRRLGSEARFADLASCTTIAQCWEVISARRARLAAGADLAEALTGRDRVHESSLRASSRNSHLRPRTRPIDHAPATTSPSRPSAPGGGPGQRWPSRCRCAMRGRASSFPNRRKDSTL